MSSSSVPPPTPTVELLEAWTREYILAAKETFANNVSEMENWLDKDYVQTGPDIGPLNRADYLQAFTTYKNSGMDFQKAAPDLLQDMQGFHLDPHNPWRVWFVVRYSGTHAGTVTLPNSDAQLEPRDPPQKLYGGPELFSIWWTREKTIKWETVGYSGDRYTGTNQGYGAVVGILIGMGLPRLAVDILTPVTKLQSWFSQFVSIGEGLPRTRTPHGELPQWWQDRQKLDFNLRA